MRLFIIIEVLNTNPTKPLPFPIPSSHPSKTMVAVNLDSVQDLQIGNYQDQHGALVEEIDGLIRVYKDKHVERPQIVPFVSPALPPELGVISRDISIETNIWARFYVPKGKNLMPLIFYFHGGGFCVGSAAWSCYHDFLAKLAAKAGCIIMSVNYRLAPENPLPAAYEDGVKALIWLRHNSSSTNNQWWSSKGNSTNVTLAGDSAGANIAYNIAKMVGSKQLSPMTINGVVLIQPFFGGEERTDSEKFLVQPKNSALSLETSDTYWRLALPKGANRDHPWCNPFMENKSSSDEIRTMVCIAEMDILRDRNLEFVDKLRKKKVVVHKGVGHAFHILGKSQVSQIRTQEMISQIRSFITSG